MVHVLTPGRHHQIAEIEQAIVSPHHGDLTGRRVLLAVKPEQQAARLFTHQIVVQPL